MTEANQKKLYEWFIKSGQEERAQEILKAYPQFEEKETKSKGKK